MPKHGDRHQESREGKQSGARPDVPTFNPERAAWGQTTEGQSSTAGGVEQLRPDQINSAEKRLQKFDDPTLQAYRERREQWIRDNSHQVGTKEYREQQKALELAKKVQGDREYASELLAAVEYQGRQQPGAYDQGSQHGSGGGIFDQNSYWSQ